MDNQSDYQVPVIRPDDFIIESSELRVNASEILDAEEEKVNEEALRYLD